MPREKIVASEKLPDILSPRLVADYIGITRDRVYMFCGLNKAVGGLPSFTIGKSRKIKKTDLFEWIATQEQTRRINS